MAADIRVGVRDPLLLSPEEWRRISGLACASCGSCARLRPGGHAYTLTGDGGRLGWAVRVCAQCPERPQTGAEARGGAMELPRTVLSWAVAAGAREADVQEAWRRGQAVEVPIGQLWEVVRATRSVGTLALHRLRAAGAEPGVVLEVPLRGTVEFLVPTGLAGSWPPMLGTKCVRTGMMRWPAPGAALRTGRRAACGRRWIVEPVASAILTTDGDALCEAVAAALAHLAGWWLDEQPTAPCTLSTERAGDDHRAEADRP
jgi:hypothetical protein